ncbi:MAG: DNA internalization-related competence protein ComEC/Rec2 [Lachnospiraceae bacterium]
MKKRPLCIICLLYILVHVLFTTIGRLQVTKELQPSTTQKQLVQDKTLNVQGQIVKKEQKETYQALYLKDHPIIIYDKTKFPYAIGNIIHVTGSLQLFDEPRNPGQFNQKFYYEKQEIYGAVKAKQITITNHQRWWLLEMLSQCRMRWKDVIYKALGQENGAILSAIILGDKCDLDVDTKELYQKSGIGHILAISGLHLSFIGLFFYRILRSLGVPFGVSGGLGILFLCSYILMVGLGVSTVRAFIMFGFRMVADITGRVCDTWTSVSVAAVCILMWRPLYIYDAGFLLSFGAIIGILLFIPMLEAIYPCPYTWLQGLYAGIAINLMLIPVLLYYYFEFPIYSILLNLVVIPCMFLLLSVGIIGSVSYPLLGGISILILKSCNLIFWMYEWLCKQISQWPMSRIISGQPRWWQILIYYLCLLGIYRKLCFSGRKKQARKWYPMVLIFCGAILQFGLGQGQHGTVEVTMLDVGQGDGIYMKGPTGMTYFFDGGSSTVKEVGKYRLEPFLKSQGVGTLDYAFVSHGDSDHINGVTEMIAREDMGVKIKTLVLPIQEVQDEALHKLAYQAWNKGIQVVTMKQGEKVIEGKMTLTCLYPGAEYLGEIGNETSQVLSVTYQEFDLLLTGDIEGKGEQQLLEGPIQKKYDVLKVAHHGSKNSTSKEFLRQIQPAYAMISAGEHNSYGHPHQELLERLQNIGCIVASTKQQGALKVWTDGKKITWQSFLDK